ncbi:hypothetical protein ACHAWF_018911 [Thalassiosira exigua]
MVVSSSVQVLVEIEQGTAIKRWLSQALVPLGKHPLSIDVSGKAFYAQLERKTRSSEHRFSESSGEEARGKICVCESFDTRSTDQAVQFAEKFGSRALLVAHEPDVGVTVPTVLVSQQQFKDIGGFPDATISVVYISGSYKALDVMIEAKRVSIDSKPVDWQSKMFVSTSMAEKASSNLTFGVMVDAARLIFRGPDNKIAHDDYSQFSGKVCLFHACYHGDTNQAVEIFTGCGARALFICCKEAPDWCSIRLSLPVVLVDREQFGALKRAGGLYSDDLGVTFSYGESNSTAKGNEVDPPSHVPSPLPPSDSESTISPRKESSYAEAAQRGANSHQSHQEERNFGRDPPESPGFWGGVVNNVTSVVGNVTKAFVGYSPKSKDDFNSILRRGGTSWSYDGPPHTSFVDAMTILARIRKLKSKTEQQDEIKVLVEAICKMTEKQSFVGDVLVMVFSAQIFSLKLEHSEVINLTNAMVVMVESILVDPKGPKPLKEMPNHRKILEQRLCLLTRSLSGRNRSNLQKFVLNVIWIRCDHCVALRDGLWTDLKQVTSLEYIERSQETILSFMDHAQFNTLIITSIARNLADVCNYFDKADTVPIRFKAVGKLREMYERNQMTKQEWMNEFGVSRELTMLKLVERLEATASTRTLIGAVVNDASFDSAHTFQGLDDIYSSLDTDCKLHDVIIDEIATSLRRSLNKRWMSCPTPAEVSDVLQTHVGLLLINKEGWNSITAFCSRLARTHHSEKDNLKLIGHIFDLFVGLQDWTDKSSLIDELMGVLSQCVTSSPSGPHAFAVNAFEVANCWRDIFTDPEEEDSQLLCSLLGHLVISRSGLAAHIFQNPSKLLDITGLHYGTSSGKTFSECLSKELIQQLTLQCTKIENAVNFCINASSSTGQTADLKGLCSDIIMKSFSQWRPSSLTMLLQVDGQTLKHAHQYLGESTEGMMHAGSIERIISSWISDYSDNGIDVHVIGQVSCVVTEEKGDVLAEISGEAFPTKIALEEKMAAIESMIDTIRHLLTFSSQKDGASCSYSLLDLATTYRIKDENGSFVSDMIAKYLHGTDPVVSLANLHRDRDRADAFLHSWSKELHAATYFATNKSVLFEHEMGVWVDTLALNFLAKMSSTLGYFASLLSPAATFSDISKAAAVIAERSVGAESEIRAINSFSHGTEAQASTLACLLDGMALAMVLNPLQKFLDCCEAHKFDFVTSDSSFSDLIDICGRLVSEEGSRSTANECHEMGVQIADILVSESGSASSNLRDRLRICLPILQFFSALRTCGAVFSMARERMWFGEEGLQTFYKEYTNVSNVFKSHRSFENEVLDRLEPTVRAISVVGGALGSISISSLMEMLKDNCDILKLDEMRLVQANISKVQDWFSEGMDDTAAVISKFALVQSSGSFIIRSESLESQSSEHPMTKRVIALQYSRSQTSNSEVESMAEDEIQEFVQHLGFVNHATGESTDAAVRFTDSFNELLKIKESQQAMLNVGFKDDFSALTVEYDPHQHDNAALVDLLEESEQRLKACTDWLKEVRSRYRYSLLFWMDELRRIFGYMVELRSMSIGLHEQLEGANTKPVRMILELLSRLSPDVSRNEECSRLLLEYIVDQPSSTISWLEDVSNLVHECGLLSERLHISCFQAVDRACHKKLVIHKINCCDDLVFCAPLHLLTHIYKRRCPASFEILDAACIKSPDEIHLFLDRALAFPDQTFTIIGVNELSSKEQQIIANFLAKHSRSEENMHLHCVQSGDTILHAPPGVEIRLWDDAAMEEDELNEWLQDHVTNRSHINEISIVCGPSGSGKTRYIRRTMKELETRGVDTASMYIHEDFSLSKAVASLNAKFRGGTSHHRAIHLSFSMGASGTPPKHLLLSINNFFNSFLILRSIYDPSFGSCFHSGMHSYGIFVELDCAESESAAQGWLRSFVPVLTCCNGVVQPPPVYTIDDQTRRVCIYLRAYDNGTIDRKFDPTPRHKRMMFVLDKSESMEIDLGGRNSLEVAADCMMSIFDSHVQMMDHVGLMRFNHQYEVLIPLQQVENDDQRGRLRNAMVAARNNPRGSTHMYTALSQAVDSLSRNSDVVAGDSWIVCLTDGQSWDSNAHLVHQLQNSADNLHIIVVGVNLDEELNDGMEQLCNKYQLGRNPRNKGFFVPTSANMQAIEGAFTRVAAQIPVSQTFELDGIMSELECRSKLEEHRPDFLDPRNKLLYSFWVNFLYRRVSVFDHNQDFNFNEDHETLGSSLMEVMLSESKQILRKEQNCSWTSSNHTQLIYDFSEGSPRFRLICTSPENLDADQRMGLSQLNLPGFTIPTTGELRERETLDRYLSQALSIPLNDGPGGRKSLKCIDDNQFVLTLDFALKLLNVHERVSCGVPCIVEGETGVSKTALTRMYCILVNSRQHSIAFASTFSDLESMLNELVTRFPTVAQDDSLGVLEQIHKFLEPSSQHSAEQASQAVHDLIKDACLRRSALFEPIPPSLMDDSEEGGTADLLEWFSESNLEPTFFDVNVHGSLTADDLQSKFDEVRHVAQKLSNMENVKVIVFLDEINTSSVLGLLKELIVDRSLNGDLLEENIVLIAACNPPRQSTLSQPKTSREIDLGREWASGHYQVKRLPFSLEMITWDYGSLNNEQEKEFIHQRIVMADEQIPDIDARGMTEMISRSHELIRELAKGHIRESILKEMAHKSDVDNESRLRARSVVSLRDIQRVFHLFNFFLHEFALGPQLIGESDDKLRRAMLLSVACVYYLRLDAASRKTFLRDLKSLPSEQYQDCHLKEVLETAINALIEHTEIPVGIALTSGLKENVFMTLVCTLSRTPLMIIGPPGCSKTLAVNTVTDNACGEESPGLLYRKLARIQPFHYQCSKSSTSNEVASVFDRATQRQSKVNRAKQQCLVFMDEAGLPEEEKESLKVLHYLLEGHMSAAPEVGFVCITNHILDAAKSNRCVCLLRPEPNKDELMCIAKGVLCQKHQGDESNIELICFDNKLMRRSEEFCADLCCCYFSLIQNKDKFSWFVHFFGLRDFIHLIMYVRRSAALMNSVLHVSVEVVVQALERNFNGVDDEKFSNICALFLQSFLRDKDCTKECLNQHRRHPMEVLHHALMDNPDHDSRYNLPRYKMIIDDTNDDSVMRLLEMAGILNSSHSFYQLSGMKEGSETEQLNLVSRVKFAAQQGDKTVVMSQVEEISECFYDLFNQHFKEFKKDGETSYFTNIAIGGISRPCIIHPRFQCIVHVQSDQLGEMPSPFLNRFEKFQLTIDDILSWQLSRLPLGIKVMMGAALSKCEELLTHLGDESIWATRPHETLKSLFIKMVRPTGSAEPIFSPCQDHNSPRRLICSGVLDFLQSSLVVEGMSVEDVEQSLVTSLSELRGIEAIELKKVLGMETSLNQSQLEKSLGHLASDASRDSPLSRCLDLIVRVLITRHAVFQLLKVAKPEAIYLQRHCLPKEMLRKYFGGQEHFHLKSFISTLTRSSSLAYAPQVCQRYMLSVRSDLCPHSLPSWCGDDRNDARTQEEALFKAKVESIVHEHPSDIEIHHLDMMKSESSVRGAINSWATTEEISCLMLVADMQLQSSPKLVNFVRAHIERVKLSSMKKFFLLLHHPLSCETPSYPALFLGTWQCVYLDGIGHQGVSSSHLSINSVFEAACFDDCSLRADSMLDALLPKALQYVASQVSFYTRSSQPQSVNQRDTEFTERLVKLEGILKSPIKGESLGRIICQQYLNMWRQEAIQEMLQRSAHGLMSGTTHLSISSAVRSTFQHTFNKFLANRIIDINMGSNLDILDDQLDLETDEIFSLVLSSLPDIPLKELLLQRDIYRPLNPLPLEKANSETLVFFPFYHHLSSFIAMILDKATAEMSSTDPASLLEGVEQVMVSLLECPASFPIDEPMVRALRDVIEAVRASPELFDKYLTHMLLWEFGIRNSTQAKRWILNKINRVEDRCRRNIIFLHAITRVNVTGIIRMSSWDFISDPIGADEGNFEGPQFVGAVLDHYKTSFPSNFDDSQEWSNSFLIFMQSIPTMIEDGTLIDDVTIVSTLRQLVFLSVVIIVKAPETTIADMANRISTGHKYTISDLFNCLMILLPTTTWQLGLQIPERSYFGYFSVQSGSRV